ncbi:BfmA/BtgA family mobilization protein [uncultured Maribacter sp.]|uniref:BfmA/BtgA family mobilization protein n=1 Tax=uncultured Maribacter sp. TaxID=431308 RepID=UPI0030EB505A
MDVKIKRKNTFSAISINRITAERFRAYSKTVSKSHSDTIDTMIDFFEKAKITPKSEVIISFIKFQNYMMGRIDYIEEVLRRMEREQLKPTHDMLKSLFEGTALKKKEQPLLVDKKSMRMTREEWNMEEGKVSFEKYHDAIKARSKDRQTFFKVLESITKVEPTFGKPYFKVEIDAVELERIRKELNGNQI